VRRGNEAAQGIRFAISIGVAFRERWWPNAPDGGSGGVSGPFRWDPAPAITNRPPFLPPNPAPKQTLISRREWARRLVRQLEMILELDPRLWLRAGALPNVLYLHS